MLGHGLSGVGLVHAPIGALRFVELLWVSPSTCATSTAGAEKGRFGAQQPTLRWVHPRLRVAALRDLSMCAYIGPWALNTHASSSGGAPPHAHNVQAGD